MRGSQRKQLSGSVLLASGWQGCRVGLGCLAGLGCLVGLACLVGTTVGCQAAEIPSDNEPANIDERATHEQVALIEVSPEGDDPMQVNAFCLAGDGNILAACGDGPGEVRVLSADGELQGAWEVPVKAEAINVAPDGTVLVAGAGQLFRYSAAGKLLKQTESPHTIALRENSEDIREQAIENVKRSFNRVGSQIEMYTQMLDAIGEKDEADLNDQEKQLLTVLPDMLERLKEQEAAQGEKEKPEISEESIQEQLKFLIEYKQAMASISSDGEHVFVATPSLVGYTFEVWRMDADFENAEVVISELRGCCGHMDVQACSQGVFVAENARHRVCHFDVDGEEIAAWGKGDRTGVEGFTSCCNPMNVCFNREGDVYTAESNSGRIKRYSAEGELLAYIGDVKLVPGCKNVSIAASEDGQRVYMLDITRNQIIVMQKKDGQNDSDADTAAVKSDTDTAAVKSDTDTAAVGNPPAVADATFSDATLN